MPRKSERQRQDFILVGEHPAIDFANTYSMPGGAWKDHFRTWDDVVDWLEIAEVSEDPGLRLSGSAAEAALAKVAEFRREWKEALAQMIDGGKAPEQWVAKINSLLAEDEFYETLDRLPGGGFRLMRSASKLRGGRLALLLLARKVAEFLAEANLHYLHRCANTASCVLYFYDTTKNHRRQWCSSAVCGNRHKVAEFRARRAGKIE